LMLCAEDFSHHLTIDKSSPYIKEPIILTLELNQTNKDVVLLFNFTLQKSNAYTFRRLDIEESDAYHNLNIKYTYLLYPLKAGEIKISFALLKKVTTDASIAYSFSGDRDNVKTLETKDTKVRLKPLILDIKALPKGTQVVGDFALSYDVPKHQAQAYEPLPFSVTLQGRGYPPVLSSLLGVEGNFRAFSQDPQIYSKTSLKGTENTIKYTMAFSHSKDFSLNPIEIKAFNPLSKQVYTLSVPQQNFSIEPIKHKMLIDKTDNPKPLTSDFKWLEEFLFYILIFLAGYATAMIVKFKSITLPQTQDNPIDAKIEACKSSKALLQVLISLQDKNFDPLIAKIENSLYQQEKKSFKDLKKEALNSM